MEFTPTNTSYLPGSHTNATSECFEVTASDLVVTKTATPTFTRTYTWDIDKSVAGTTTRTIADGASTQFDYTVAVTHDAGTNSAWAVSGNITVTNPNAVAITGVDITDAINDGNATCIVTDGTGVTVPASGNVVRAYTCTYSAAPSQTNTATATWPDFGSAGTSDTGTAAVTWGDPTTIVDGSLAVVDDKTNPGSPVELGTAAYTDASPKNFTYSLTKGGVAGICTDYTNTATFTTNTTATTGSDSQLVTVCVGVDLTVTKTATPAFNRTFTWTIDKDVNDTSITIAQGGTATFNYTVDVVKSAPIDSGWVVNGTITVTNPNAFQAVVVDISDSLPNGATCTITGGGTAVNVPASGNVVKSYSCTYAAAPNPDPATNTATATWDAAAAHTPTGTAFGTAGVNFGTTSPTVTNNSVTVVDDKTDPDNPVTLGTTSVSHQYIYSLDKSGVAGTCTDYTNIAIIQGTALSDTVTVAVCVLKDLTVSKDATPTFTRTFAWDIDKSVDFTTIDVADGLATFNYTVSVTHDAGTDSAWKVNGTITVTNPNNFGSITLGNVTDAVNNGGVCTVTGNTTATIAALASVQLTYECTYAASPTSASGTNTATATWNAAANGTPTGSASGSAPLAFTTPTTIVDGSITVVDDETAPPAAISLGTASYTEASPKTFTYSLSLPGVAGTCTNYTNTATFTTNTTSSSEFGSQVVTVCIATATVIKTDNGSAPLYAYTFVLSGSPASMSISRTVAPPNGTLDFGQVLPGTYQLCELAVPAGTTSSLASFPGGSTDPNSGDTCAPITIASGEAKVIDVDNTRPGGDQRTIGYWKNWNRCSHEGSFVDRAAKTGNHLLEEFLAQTIGDLPVEDCVTAVMVLSKNGFDGKSHNSDAAYNLAAQLLAAKLNVEAGAGTCTAATAAIADGQALLVSEDFMATGDYWKGGKDAATNRALALSLAATLDQYNNGNLC